jgi:membrane protein DedA with SNARE-associated domain
MTAATLAAIFGISSSLGYLLPAIIGLESMGIPSPGETALVLAAVLASQGKLEIGLVILIGVASAIIGDNLGYLLGRHFGRDAILGRGPLQAHRKRAVAYGDDFFDRHGAKAVFFARWVALVRFAAAWLAGINRMPFGQFFFWNALGAISWGVTFALVGYFAGEAGSRVLAKVGIAGAGLLAAMFIGTVVLVIRRERRARPDSPSEGDPPSKADPPEAQ